MRSGGSSPGILDQNRVCSPYSAARGAKRASVEEDFHSPVLFGKSWKTTASFWPRESDLFPVLCVQNLMRNSATSKVSGLVWPLLFP